MLVDEYRHRAAAGSKDLESFLPESAFRVLGVACGRLGIIPVLGNQQNSLHGQPAGAEGQGIFNRRADPKAV